MRIAIALALFSAGVLPAAEWVPVTKALIEKEKPGTGGLSGVVVDRANGDLYIWLSDRGLYRSSDRGQNWAKVSQTPAKGRTETSGCLVFDPVGPGKKMSIALVYGSPLILSPDRGQTFKVLNNKSSHIDWCALDWADPDHKFILALKHEAGDLLLVSRDGGQSFDEVGKGYGPAWIFDGKTAVVAQAKSKTQPKPGLLRTVDAGKTFEPAGDYYARALPRYFKNTLYWVVEGAVIASSDQGKSWKKLGDLKDGRSGPVFGKDERHQFVLTGSGIVESKDGGATWSAPIKLPGELKGGVTQLNWFEYDVAGDVLYAMKMFADLYAMKR